MLTEYLKQSNPAEAVWYDGMPGVRACRFSLRNPGDSHPLPLPPALEPLHLETFFCLQGSLLLERSGGRFFPVHPHTVLLLSDSHSILGATTGGDLAGILVSVDARAARESLSALCGLMGRLELDTAEVGRRMAEYEGCAQLGQSDWSQSVFTELEHLPATEQGHYCVWKSVELLYLLCKRSQLLAPVPPAAPVSPRMAGRIREMQAYMEQHLNEKLTIPMVCDKFYLSPTSFKKYFRCVYGQPVHRWLQSRRLDRAAELLRYSNLTVLRVAQSIGYDGLSQFNAAFKRRFGQTPSQFRNASKSGNPEADSAGQMEKIPL